jgi:hypothetical protein
MEQRKTETDQTPQQGKDSSQRRGTGPASFPEAVPLPGVGTVTVFQVKNLGVGTIECRVRVTAEWSGLRTVLARMRDLPADVGWEFELDLSLYSLKELCLAGLAADRGMKVGLAVARVDCVLEQRECARLDSLLREVQETLSPQRRP